MICILQYKDFLISLVVKDNLSWLLTKESVRCLTSLGLFLKPNRWFNNWIHQNQGLFLWCYVRLRHLTMKRRRLAGRQQPTPRGRPFRTRWNPTSACTSSRWSSTTNTSEILFLFFNCYNSQFNYWKKNLGKNSVGKKSFWNKHTCMVSKCIFKSLIGGEFLIIYPTNLEFMRCVLKLNQKFVRHR